MAERINKITSDNRSQPLRLFAVWLFLIILPALSLTIGFDIILKDSEKHLTDKLKIRMMQEMKDFRSKLSFTNMIETKMQQVTVSENHSNAARLQHQICQQSDLTPCAVFLIDHDHKLTWQLHNSVKKVFGIISKTMMRNYLLHLIEQAYDQPREKISESAVTRSKHYLRTLLATAGQSKIRPNQTVSALSGKPELGRIVFWFMPIDKTAGALLIFREMDISLEQLASHARSIRLYADLERSYCFSHEGKEAIYYPGQETMTFQSSADNSLILKGMVSEEALLRLMTRGSYYPIALAKVRQKLPLLQIRAEKSVQQHPLRQAYQQTRHVSAIVILLASIFLLRVAFFGYGSGSRIRTRLFIWVAGASLLPFATFIAGIFYQDNFSQEFAKAEISQYLHLQHDFITKSINARINVEERNLARLSEELGRLDLAASLEHLSKWQRQSPSALLLYHENDKEYTFTSRPDERLDKTEAEMKTMAFLSLADALGRIGKDADQSNSTLGAIGFKIKGLNIILENVGKLYDAMSDKIISVFSSFPVYADNKRFSAPKAYIMVKYYTRSLIESYLKLHPELFTPETRGNYRIVNCFITISDKAKMPTDKDIIHPKKFDLSPYRSLIRKTMHTRSFSEWSDGKKTVIAGYHNRLHCIMLHIATPSGLSEKNDNKAVSVLLYFLLLVLTLVVFMARMLIEPIELLKLGAEMVTKGNYQQRIEFSSGDEFEPLTDSFNSMTAGLYQRELLSSYVSQDVLTEVSSDTTLLPGGERVEASVVFCALKGFREHSRRADPEQVVNIIGRLIEITDRAAINHGGVMDKLIEDTVMLVFRQKDDYNTHAISACRAALEINRAFPGVEAPFQVVTGIASGTAVSGKIGSKTGKLDFTLIGNPVNLAARLKAHAHKAEKTGIIVCPTTIRLLKGRARLHFIERTEIKGRSRTFPLYELSELR